MNDSAVRVQPNDLSVPLVASIPHGADFIPARFGGAILREPEHLRSDWGTRELYDFLPALNVSTVEAVWSRFVADANRDPDMPKLGRFNEAIVAITDGSGVPIYREPPGPDEVQQRIDEAFVPYHQALGTQIARLLERHPRVLVLDLHSFGVELAADMIIGDADGTTARSAVTGMAQTALTQAGLMCSLNEKFRGGWIVRQFADNDRVDALQLELNQRTYLRATEVDQNIWPRHKDPLGFEMTKERLVTAVRGIIAEYMRLT